MSPEWVKVTYKKPCKLAQYSMQINSPQCLASFGKALGDSAHNFRIMLSAAGAVKPQACGDDECSLAARGKGAG
jgi:hypothetical protein